MKWVPQLPTILFLHSVGCLAILNTEYHIVCIMQGEDTEWVDVKLRSANPTVDDWVGVFSPAKFKYCPHLFLSMPLFFLFP